MAGHPAFESFGSYLLVHRLAMGGMAEIFLAAPMHGSSRQLCVIKRLREDLSHDKDFVGMIIDEARVVRQLSHPNIIRLLEFGQVQQRYFLALEHVWGESLRTLTLLCTKQKMRFPMGAALLIGAETATALEFAHSYRDATGELVPIFHRDVTLGNVMVSYDGDVKVLDFGIAKTKGRMSHTRAGQIKGTLAYLTPEQLLGTEIGPYTDIYQLGVLLYQTLVGRLPIAPGGEGAVMAAIVAGNIIRPSEVVPGFPRDIEKILLKAMAREPAKRFSSAGELAGALRLLLRGTPYDEGRPRLAHILHNLTGNRRALQEEFVRSVIQGATIHSDPTDIFRWAAPGDAPETLNVELSSTFGDEELELFEEAPTVVMSDHALAAIVTQGVPVESSESSGAMPLADADFDAHSHEYSQPSALRAAPGGTPRGGSRGDEVLEEPPTLSDVASDTLPASGPSPVPIEVELAGATAPDFIEALEEIPSVAGRIDGLQPLDAAQFDPRLRPEAAGIVPDPISDPDISSPVAARSPRAPSSPAGGAPAHTLGEEDGNAWGDGDSTQDQGASISQVAREIGARRGSGAGRGVGLFALFFLLGCALGLVVLSFAVFPEVGQQLMVETRRQLDALQPPRAAREPELAPAREPEAERTAPAAGDVAPEDR